MDAWFDITTRSTGRSLAEAVLLAVFFELPAAALSLMIVSRANAHLAMSRRSTEGDGCCAA